MTDTSDTALTVEQARRRVFLTFNQDQPERWTFEQSVAVDDYEAAITREAQAPLRATLVEVGALDDPFEKDVDYEAKFWAAIAIVERALASPEEDAG